MLLYNNFIHKSTSYYIFIKGTNSNIRIVIRKLSSKIGSLTQSLLYDTEYKTGYYYLGKDVYIYFWMVYDSNFTNQRDFTLPTVVSSNLCCAVDCKVYSNTSKNDLYFNRYVTSQIVVEFPQWGDPTILRASTVKEGATYIVGRTAFLLMYTKTI